MTQQEARERVQRGAALLDEKRPGWATRINSDKLRLHSSCDCVLGQLEGSFKAACETLFPERVSSAILGLQCDREVAAVRNGFNTQADDSIAETWKLLQAAWIDEIERRLVSVTWTHRERVSAE